MRSEVELDSGRAEDLQEILKPSLENSGKIGHELRSENETLSVGVETETFGQLRGCTDTVFRLGSLAKKILER
ncbi:MAG: hypothetical protein ABEJ56_02540 [Candidatus Nanohaloarchaea archaeon]